MDHSLPGSSTHWILRARILEWVAISFFRESSWPRDLTRVSRIAGRCFNLWATKPCCWHWVVVKESSAFVAGYQARRTDSSCSEDLNSVMAFREGVLKAVWGRGPQSMWSAYAQFLDWLAWRWNLKHHQPFAFSQSRISALMVSSFYQVGVCFL